LAAICYVLVFGVHCVGAGDTSGFARAQLDCEAAVALLTQCCPGFEPRRVSCGRRDDQETSGCIFSTTTTYVEEPNLHEAESECILSESCDSLVATGVCKRVENAVRNGPVLLRDDQRRIGMRGRVHPHVRRSFASQPLRRGLPE